MLESVSLSNLRQQYLTGKINKKQFEGAIFQYLLDHQNRFHVYTGNTDRWPDFLSWLYPRISRTVDSYRDTGTSFDTYIAAVIHWSYREYRNKEAQHYATEYACWTARAEELAVSSPEPEYSTSGPGEQNWLTRLSPDMFTDQQILILFLKSYYFVSEDLITRISLSLGIKKEKLWDMVNTLHRMRLQREQEIQEIQAGMHCQYYRCMAYQKRLLSLQPESALYEKLGDRINRARRCFRNMKKRLAGIRFDATNYQIAEILQIPKGTVDSTLHTIQNKSKRLGFVWKRPLYSKNQA